MVSDEKWIEKVYTAFFEQPFPTDLKIILIWLAATILAIYLPVLNESPIRGILTLPGILFLPGYVLIAALFPGEGDIDFIERIALSFGLSIAVVPLIGLGLNFTPWGIRLEPVMVSLIIFTLAMILVAHFRRSLLQPEKQFRVPFRECLGTVQETFTSKNGNKIDRILTMVLVLAIITAILTTVYVIMVPKQGEGFTEFFILGEGQKAADYPYQINIGQKYPLYIGIGNHEYRPVTYTIESWGVLMESDNTTNSPHIITMDPLWKQTVTLVHNGTLTIPYSLSVEKSGYNRIEFLLFNESVPLSRGLDRVNASYRDLHLRITVDSG